MKVAVCMSGHMRQYKKCIDSFKSFMIGGGASQYDVFLSTWEEFGGSGKYAYDPYVKALVPRDEVCKDYDTKGARFEKANLMYRAPGGQRALVFHNKFGQHYHAYKADLLRRKYEKENSVKYDLVFKTRPDIYHLKTPPVFRLGVLDPNSLYHSTGYQREDEDGVVKTWNVWKKDFPLGYFEKVLEYEKSHFGPSQQEIKDRIVSFLPLLDLDEFKEFILEDLDLDFDLTLGRQKTGRKCAQLQDCMSWSTPYYGRLYALCFLMILKWIASPNKFTYPFDQYWHVNGKQNGSGPWLEEEYGYFDTSDILNYNMWKYEVDFFELESAIWTVGRAV